MMEDQKAVFASCESMRISKEQGNPAQLELREKARVNDNTIAMVKKMSFVLSNREFVFRQIWKSEEGKVFPQALGAIQQAIDGFRQDEKVDTAELRDKATFMRERGQDEVYSKEEVRHREDDLI